MSDLSSTLQRILQDIVARRRSEDRKLVRVSDPLGLTSLSGVIIDSNKTLGEVHVESPGVNATSNRRSFSIARSALMTDVADALDLTPLFEVSIDLLVDVLPKPMYMHLRTMAGDKITLVGDQDELSTVKVRTFLGYGTNLRSPDERGKLNAESAVRHFTSRATSEECQLFLEMVYKDPKCVFSENHFAHPFDLDFGEDQESEQWFEILFAADRDVCQGRDGESGFEKVWKAVVKSFDDPGGRFSQLLQLTTALNRVVTAGDYLFPKRSQCYTVLMEAKQRYLKNGHQIVQKINAGEVEELQASLTTLQQRCWSIQHTESDEHKRKLEAWLNDKSLNNHGIPRGVINRYRYELSLHGNDIDKALTIRDAVLQRDAGICQHCGREVITTREIGQSEESQVMVAELFHIDHIVPLARGGTNDSANLQLLCETCNLRKGSKLESEMQPEVARNFYKNRIKQRS